MVDFEMIKDKGVQMAFDIADIVLDDMGDRKGIKNELEQCEPETLIMIKWELAQKIHIYLEGTSK